MYRCEPRQYVMYISIKTLKLNDKVKFYHKIEVSKTSMVEAVVKSFFVTDTRAQISSIYLFPVKNKNFFLPVYISIIFLFRIFKLNA